MPRGKRLTFDNATFHIINRGNARQDIFHDEEDFEKFLHIIARYKDKFGFMRNLASTQLNDREIIENLF